VIGIDASNAIEISAKTGLNIVSVLEAIVDQIPPPTITDVSAPLQALLVDSWYDKYLGVMILVRIISGQIRQDDQIKMLATGAEHEVAKVGVFTPKPLHLATLSAGEIGFITANVKTIEDTKVGDTITHTKKPCNKALEGFKEVQPVVFCGLFPTDNGKFEELRDALGKLKLNDSSLFYEPDNSAALGIGFRCGCLGLLHLEIIQERLEREFDIDLITTAPSVVYKINLKNGENIELHNPADLPDLTKVQSLEEPWIKATIFVPDEYLGNVLSLCTERRGIQEMLTYAGNRAMVIYKLPLNEVIFDFYDKLKSATSGYASFDYELAGYEEGDLVKLNILVQSDCVDALSCIVHRSQAEYRGRAMCKKLKEIIPSQQFQVPVQAAIGGKIIARETVKAFRKDVTGHLYGGDVTRKKKLLEKQKKGKKKMRQIGSVEIPQSAFIQVLKT
jgi:GTP-binding protein LepA